MQESDKTIIFNNVSKKFKLYGIGTRSLKSAVLDLLMIKNTKKKDFWALNEIDFSVKKGETLGIIGANGAGKSTLLSLIAGTIMPTSGKIITRGTISSLLELGAGFHPDLTGRENIYLYGAIIGLSRKQMDKRFDAIVDFAGIEKFIDQPVKHYSSGMYVRLGFSVAVEVEPDILLIDEVLAVGDTNFQRKCIKRMEEFRNDGKTMLIISHDLHTIQSVSDRILLLDKGKVIGIGDPENVVDVYQSLSRKKNAKGLQREWGTGEAKIACGRFFNEKGIETDKFQWGATLKVEIEYNSSSRILNPVFGFAISDESGHLIYGSNTQIEDFEIPFIEGNGVINLKFDKIAMSTGTYLFSFSIHSSDHKTNYHRLDNCFPIAVESEKPFEGYCYMPYSWNKNI